MSAMIVLLILVVGVPVFLKILKLTASGDKDDIWPFYATKPLSHPEQILYFRLIQALPEHVILAQVQLYRFLGVKKSYKYTEWFNRINRLSADFVVCKKDFSLVILHFQKKHIPLLRKDSPNVKLDQYLKTLK
jgi:hypothetical protein